MRLPQLDILRGIAILLVLGKHVEPQPADLPLPLRRVFHFWREFGWTGVDLFFVLSGFLIAGLLFNEHKKYGCIRFGRFFVRRGLKIYPGFYAMLFGTLAAGLVAGEVKAWPLLCEALFIQNYGANVWNHTWSLAVEEHFYLLLPLLLIALARIDPRDRDPFRPLLLVGIALAILCLSLRMDTSLELRYRFRTHLGPTHLRIDSLFAGVVLAYLFHYRPAVGKAITRCPAWILIAASFAALLPCLWIRNEQAFFMHTWGPTFLYLGYSGLLLFALHHRGALAGTDRTALRRTEKALAAIGFYSYSIYLWHMPVIIWGGKLLHHLGLGLLPPSVRFVLLFAACLLAGWLMAWLVEIRVLRWRNRRFPSRGSPLPPPAS